MRNLGWLGAAQLVNRVFRLATTVVLARLLAPDDYGLAALVLTTNEFVNVFTRCGIGTKLIQAREEDMPVYCDTAYWLTWIVCIVLFVGQCALALPVGLFYGRSAIVLPICAMALVYLTLPFGYVQAMLLMRENRLEVGALTNAVQLSVDCLLTIAFALGGLGLWAVILPKILVAPLWSLIHIYNHPWRAPRQFTLARWQEIFRFGRNVLGVELLATLRANVDYLLVGRFLGVEALGVYYFAFNAGLGISLSLISAFDMALYPHLCAANQQPEQLRQRFHRALKTLALLFVPLVLLQASLAPFYVPIIFSSKWAAAGAIPVLVLICLSALPRPFAGAASQVLHALNRPEVDLQWNLLFTPLLIVALLAGLNWGILGVAAAVLATHLLLLPLFALWADRYCFTSAHSPVPASV